MVAILLKIAGQCDGVRCDMAMLVLPDVFERTWGRRAPLFWPDATRRVRERLYAGLDYQDKLARFLENHDEPRAAATFPPGVHEAAAVVTFLSPGLRFFHQGQLAGRRKRISPHLGRGPDEPVDQAVGKFYDRLLAALRQPTFR